MKNKLKNMLQSLNGITIRKKLLLSYFLLIFIPLMIITVASYVNVSTSYESQLKYSSSQSFDQAYRFLSYKINSLIKASDIVYFDSGVQTILNRSEQKYKSDIVQQNIDMIYLDNFLYNFRNSEDVYRVCLYVPDWVMYANQDINFSSLEELKKSSDYKSLMDSKDKVSWFKPGIIKDEGSSFDSVPVIYMLRKIRNNEKIGEYIGVVKVSILESNVKDIIMKANITRNGVVYIENSNGDIICCSNKGMLDKFHLKENINKKLLGQDALWKNIKIENENFNVIARPIDNSDWTMITAIPHSEITSQGDKIRAYMIELVFIIGLIAYLLAYIFSNSMTSRLSLLMNKMISVQEGNLNVSISSKSQDEIGQLMNSFNFMIERVNQLVKEQYKSGKEIKNAELKALQAQINPHFLYNTLELINWKAIDNDVIEIAEISQSLARYYKLSLNKGKDIVAIRDEIKHVETYVQIQNLRFDNRINFIMDISEEIYDYSILKIILQPIVENSILHGILENRDKQEGTITLTGKKDNDIILLNVKDDGVGMTEEKAIEILTVHRNSENHGYGVKNINDRIKLCYGGQYGLSYKSSPKNGTEVLIKIPAVKYDN